MKCCWLHIGMHKTGTTSLQANLRRIGRTDQWEYICVGGKLHMNTPFHAMFATNPFHYHWFDKQGITPEALAEKGEDLRQRFAEAISNSSSETVIVSAEALPLVDKAGIQRLKDFLDPLFDQIHVIGYVRPPISYKISILQEMIKGGRSTLELDKIKLNYRRKFEKFDQVFGRENVMLRKFDPSSFAHGCTVSDFFSSIGLEPPDRSSITRTNESLSLDACGILYAYRKFGPGYGSGPGVVAENLQLIKVLTAMNGPKFTIARSMAAAGMDSEVADIQWMEDRLGADLSESPAGGDGITCEADLLHISSESLGQFVKRFQRMQKSKIPPEQIPSGNPVEPEKVASLVEFCRAIVRAKLALQSEKQASRRKGIRGLLRRFRRRFGKANRRS